MKSRLISLLLTVLATVFSPAFANNSAHGSHHDKLDVDLENPYVEPGMGSEISPFAYISSNAIWPTLTINVCWINPGSTNINERSWVKESVERTWGRNSRLIFAGWGQCPTQNQGNAVRIQIEDVRSNAYVGKYAATQPISMRLNFSYTAYGGTSVCKTGGSTAYRQCVEGTAVHEFGHTLGFIHEQNRPDNPDPNNSYCPRVAGEIPSDAIAIGGLDINSIMHYCNPEYLNYGELSDGDIYAVQTYYKKPLSDSNGTFNADVYLDLNPDLKAIYGRNHDALYNHWIQWGIQAGLRASFEFDAKYYLSANPDLVAAYGQNYVAAYNHWIQWGINEGRSASREFNTKEYLNKNPDLKSYYGATAYRSALNHWLQWGYKEKRQSSASFYAKNYWGRYPDIYDIAKYTSSMSTYTFDAHKVFLHWINIGRLAGRIGY